MKSMKKTGFESLLIVPERRDFRDSEETEGAWTRPAKSGGRGGGGGASAGSDDIDAITEKFHRTTLQKHRKSNRVSVSRVQEERICDTSPEQKDASIERVMKSMKKTGFESLLIVPERRDFRDLEETEGAWTRPAKSGCRGGGGGASAGSDDIDAITEKFHRTTLQKHRKSNRGQSEDRSSSSKHSSRKRDPKIDKQIRAPWYLEDLIEEHLNRFRSRTDDVAKLTVPEPAPPLELASVGWFGDWRPSSMLNLLLVMSRSSASFSESEGLEFTVPELTRVTRIEEAVIDEEMAEIQATCILNLPFAFPGHQRDAESSVRFELGKIKRVAAKARKLQLRTLEEVVKRVLSPTDALQFLVAFQRVKDVVHQFAAKREFKKPEVTFSDKALGRMEKYS